MITSSATAAILPMPEVRCRCRRKVVSSCHSSTISQLEATKASEFISCNLRNSSRAAKQLMQHCENILRIMTMEILFELSTRSAELIIRWKGLSQEPITEALCNRYMRT